MPKATRRNVAPVAVRVPTKPYHVFDKSAKTLGGTAVKDGIVVLSGADARYWLDQGMIGAEPLDKQSAKAKTLLTQMNHRIKPPTPEKPVAAKPTAPVHRPAPPAPAPAPKA